MTLDELETAVGQHLEGMGSTPIAWPNANFTPDGIYLEFRHSPVSVDDPVIAGGYEYQQGLFLITAVAPAGEFTGAASQLAGQVRARFKKATRLAAGGGSVVINAPPSFGVPFQDGVYWRQPVRVSYITE